MTARQGLPVWWRCADGPDHEWQAQIRSRTISGSRCPFCTGRRVARRNSIARTNPTVAAQSHPTRNGAKLATDFSYGSDAYAWWQCDRFAGHAWRARINSRTGIIASGVRAARPSPARVAVLRQSVRPGSRRPRRVTAAISGHTPTGATSGCISMNGPTLLVSSMANRMQQPAWRPSRM